MSKRSRRNKDQKKVERPRGKARALEPIVTLDEQRNYPTKERVLRADEADDGMTLLRGQDNRPRAIVSKPLRLDKLLKANVIDEEQHSDGIALTNLWRVANKSFMAG